MSDETIKQLERAYGEALIAYNDLREERDELRAKKLLAAKSEIEVELNQLYGERLEELRRVEVEAEQALLSAREAAAAEKSPYPIGTKLVRWVKKRRGGRHYDFWWEWENAGYAVVEVCTRESAHPDNWNGYRLAEPGDIIFRHLKKDGTPGIQYTKLGDSSAKFLPEGETP